MLYTLKTSPQTRSDKNKSPGLKISEEWKDIWEIRLKLPTQDLAVKFPKISKNVIVKINCRDCRSLYEVQFSSVYFIPKGNREVLQSIKQGLEKMVCLLQRM